MANWAVIASEAKQSSICVPRSGLLRRFAPRNDWHYSLLASISGALSGSLTRIRNDAAASARIPTWP
jgi:hypothetical protein